MGQTVSDARFALSCVVPDEQASPEARRLLLAFHRREVDLAAPSLWEYEIANALRVSVARRRLTQQEASRALRWLLDLGISLREFAPIADRTWDLALEHQLTVYDAAYLALAEEHGCPLYTGDKRLAEAARRVGIRGDLAEGD